MQGSPSPTKRKVSLRTQVLQRRDARRIAVAGVVVAACAAAVTLWLLRRRDQADFVHRAEALTARVEESLVAPLEALKAVDAFTQAIEGPSSEAFARFANRFLSRYPSLAALEWLQMVRADQRADFEARGSLERGRAFEIRAPDATGAMTRSPPRDRYAVITRLAPYSPELDGFDGAYEPARARFLDEAAHRGTTTASTKFRLVEDPPGTYSVAVYEPQFAGHPPTLAAAAVALYRIGPLMRRALHGGLRSGDQLTLIDDDPALAPPDRVMFSSATSPAHGLTYTRVIPFGGKHWLAVVSAPRTSHAVAALGVFCFATLLAAAVAIAISATRASAALRRSNRALASLGQYRLVRLLASGGMGHVYEAQHTLLRRRTAVKVIAATQPTDDMRALFDEEAKITSVLTHPNTITVFDYGHTSDGEFYFAMEYVSGLGLDTLVQRYGRMSPARARHVLVQICGSLAEAHALGVVHRDIKPGNIMVGPRAGSYDHVKVLDFGLAKTKRNAPDSVVGTPRYMAPEAFTTPEVLTSSADIYSLGCVAFFLLTAQDAFEQDSSDAIVEAQLSLPPPTVESRNVELPAAFERVIAKCLDRDPEQRYRSAGHLAAALTQLSLGEWTAVDAAQWWAAIDLQAEPATTGPALRTIQIRPM